MGREVIMLEECVCMCGENMSQTQLCRSLFVADEQLSSKADDVRARLPPKLDYDAFQQTQNSCAKQLAIGFWNTNLFSPS
jgi:chromosome condensin MukBEF complex kleisin-like MukF subunit